MTGARFKNIPKVSPRPSDVEVGKAIAAMRYNIEQLINNGLSQGVFNAQYSQIPASAIAQQTFGEADTEAPEDAPVPPDGPVLNLTATGAYTTIVLAWDAPLRWDYFEVYRAEDNIIGNAELLATTTSELYNDSPPQADTDYYYWVRPVHEGLNGPWAGPVSAQVVAIDVTGDTTPPPVVTGLTGTPAYTTIILEWTDPGGTAYEYEVWRHTTGGGDPISAGGEQIAVSRALVYADAPPTADTDYYYWVRARSRADVLGAFSAVAGPYQVPAIQASDPGPDLDPPGTPQGLYVYEGIRTLILSWSQPTDNDIDYIDVYRNTTNNFGTAIKIGKTKASVYVDTIDPADPVGPYYYWVQAVDTSGNLGGVSVGASGTLAQISGEEIGNGVIDETKIEDDAISTPKLQANAVVADIIAAGAVIAEKIAAGQITAEKLAAASVVAGKIAVDAVDANAIQANAITTAKLDALSVTAAKIAAGSIGADKIAAAAVTAEKILAGSITTDKLDANAVTAEKLAAGAIVADSAVIADGAITNAKIGNAAVTNAKISGAIQSNNYVAGVSGWKIDKDGDVEFDSGKFRGTIEAGAVVVGELVGYDNLVPGSTFGVQASSRSNINAAGASVWTLLKEWTPTGNVQATQVISTISMIAQNYAGTTASFALRFTAIEDGTPFVSDVIGNMIMRPRISVGLPDSYPVSYTFSRGLFPDRTYTFQWWARNSSPDTGLGNFEFASVQAIWHLLRK